MAEDYDFQKMKKEAEFIDSVANTLPDIKNALEKEFEKSTDGAEARFLKDILDSYLKDRTTFHSFFISGENGKRGVDMLISGLEHPQSHFKPDENLIKELKRLVEKLKKSNVPTHECFRHYVKVGKDLNELKPSEKVYEFMVGFNNLVKSAAEFPPGIPANNQVAQAIKEKEKSLKKVFALEKAKEAIGLWKILFTRLSIPYIYSEDIQAFEAYFAKKENQSVSDFRIRLGFVKEQEDNDWSNMKSLQALLKKEGKNSAFYRLMKAAGQEEQFRTIAFDDMVKGQNKRAEIKQYFEMINSGDNKRKIELDAAKEIFDKVNEQLKSWHKSIEEMRINFRKILENRLDEINKKHSKALKRVEEIDTQVQSKGVYLEELGMTRNFVLENIQKTEQSIDKSLISAQEILDIICIWTCGQLFRIKKISEQDFDSEFAKKMHSDSSENAKSLMNSTYQLFKAVDSMPIDEFKSRLARLNQTLKSLDSNMRLLRAKISQDIETGDDLLRGYREIDTSLIRNLDETSKSAKDDMREIHKLHLPVEEYDLSPEEESFYKDTA